MTEGYDDEKFYDDVVFCRINLNTAAILFYAFLVFKIVISAFF